MDSPSVHGFCRGGWQRSLCSQTWARGSWIVTRTVLCLQGKECETRFHPEWTSFLPGDLCVVCVARDFLAPESPPDPSYKLAFLSQPIELTFMESVMYTLQRILCCHSWSVLSLLCSSKRFRLCACDWANHRKNSLHHIVLYLNALKWATQSQTPLKFEPTLASESCCAGLPSWSCGLSIWGPRRSERPWFSFSH